MIGVKIKGLDELVYDSRVSVDVLKKEVKWALAQSVNAVKNSAQRTVAYKTGTLRRSISTDVQESSLKGIVFQDPQQANYGIYIEYGTKPHDIYPTTKKVLADSRSSTIFGMHVRHPGTQAKPYMGPALESNLGVIQDYFDRAILKVVQSLGK